MKIIDDSSDPVFVIPAGLDYVRIRIGWPRGGQARYARLDASGARTLGCALLLAAERSGRLTTKRLEHRLDAALSALGHLNRESTAKRRRELDAKFSKGI